MAEEFISFAELLWKLPLFDDLFLSMQGQNVMLVDLYLRDLERALLKELIEVEHTPFPATLIVSALSQMWIFAVYELLRTWRQRVKDLKRDAQKPAVQQSGHSKLAGMYYQSQLAHLRNKPTYAKELDRAVNLIDPLFKRIEALRMNLAKHEVPKLHGVPAMAPGYGRIDGMTGSISWQVDLGNNLVDHVSRRSLADQLKTLVIDKRSELLRARSINNLTITLSKRLGKGQKEQTSMSSKCVSMVDCSVLFLSADALNYSLRVVAPLCEAKSPKASGKPISRI